MSLVSLASRAVQSKQTLVNVFYAIPIPLEVFSTLFRLYVKISRRNDGILSFDDYFMIFATIVAVAECIAGLVYGAPYGLGKHIWDVSDKDVSMFLMGDYIFSHFYDIAIGLTKLSVLAVYYRIFATQRFRFIVICTATFIVAWVIVMEVVLGLGCRPIKAWWGAAPEGTYTCVDKVKFTYFTNIVNLLADLWIFAMPIPIILKLKASTDKRVSLLFMFSVGLGTCALSAARMSFIFGVAAKDFTWDEAPLGILSAWEPCGGILCANLPIVYRTMADGMKRFRTTVSASRSRTAHRKYSQTLEPGSKRRSVREIVHPEWSGGSRPDATGVVSQVYATRNDDSDSGTNSTELHNYKSTRIVMETSFRVESEPGDAWPLPSNNEGNSWPLPKEGV